MNTLTYTSGNLLSPVPSCSTDTSYEQTKKTLIKELSDSIGILKEYLDFKEKLNEEERQATLSKPYMSLTDVRKAIRKREVRITHFIETLTDNQVTLLYLLFQAGSYLQSEMMEADDDPFKLLYRYIDSEFNFNQTNNRQFKLSYFHDYLFARADAAQHVRIALEELKDDFTRLKK